ncbi:hypothetical protein N9219_01745 [bacterium]|nr:hypothetical protein [bacterium]
MGTQAQQTIYGSWGVDGGLLTPSFTTGYANKTYTELDCLSFTNYLTYMTYAIAPRGIFQQASNPTITLRVGHNGNSDIEKKVFWYDVDNVVQSVVIDSIPDASFTQAYIQHVYRIELYDYQQQTGSDSKSRATFQWKILEDGVVIEESHDGTTQLNSVFASQPPSKDVSDNWCNTPVVAISSDGYNLFGVSQVEFDDFKISVNGDESCIP